MAITVLLVFLLGAVLGMRFKVLILIPAIAFALLTIFAGGIGTGDSLWAALSAAVLASICLQIGYLGGTVTRHTMALARAQRLRRTAREVEPVR
jgi:hypothetical protein